MYLLSEIYVVFWKPKLFDFVKPLRETYLLKIKWLHHDHELLKNQNNNLFYSLYSCSMPLVDRVTDFPKIEAIVLLHQPNHNSTKINKKIDDKRGSAVI